MKYSFKIIKKIFICFLCINILLASSYIFADDLDYDEEIYDTSNKEDTINSIETSSNNKNSKLNLNSRSCIVYDRNSKQILFGKNEYNKVKMASTTKIMTAIVVLETTDLSQTIEVSKKAANTGRIKIRA